MKGDADGVGIVPMRLERVIREEGLDPLESARQGRDPDPIGRRRAARSFKTLGPANLHNRCYALLYQKRTPRATGRIADMQGLLGFVLAGLALAGSPGPATLSLAASAAAFGVRRSLGYMIGIVAGMVVVMGLVAAGVVGVLLAVPGATPVVAALAELYFAYLALRIATAPPLSEQAVRDRQPCFGGGLFLSLVNPKGYAAMAALFSGFVLMRDRLALDAAAKVIVLSAIIAAVDMAWLAAGAALTRCFGDPRASRAINVTFAVLLVASVAFALAL